MKDLITFRVGGSRYALPAELVSEIVEVGPISHRLPGKDGPGPGLAEVRGRWVPVLELADAVPDARPTPPEVEDSLLLLLGKGSARLGLRVEDVSDVAVVTRRAASPRSESDLIELNGELVQLVDASALPCADLLTDEGDAMTDNPTTRERAQIVAFRLCDDEFGVDVMKTREVLKPAGVRKVPEAPEFIEGMASIRESVVPVIDMRKRLSLPERSKGDPSRLLVVAIGESQVALEVDDVPGVIELSREAIRPAPELFRGLERRYLEGIVRDGERLMILLDLEEVLTSKERLALEKLVEASEPSASEEVVASESKGRKTKGGSSKKPKKKRRSKKKKAD